MTSEEIERKRRRDAALGMESWLSAYDRTKLFLEKLQKENYDSVLIVTHDIIAHYLAGLLSNQEMDFTTYKYKRNFKNAEIKSFSI